MRVEGAGLPACVSLSVPDPSRMHKLAGGCLGRDSKPKKDLTSKESVGEAQVPLDPTVSECETCHRTKFGDDHVMW